MIENRMTPNIDLFARIQTSKIDTMGDGMRLQRVEKPETNDFKSVMSGLVENLNQEMNAPDQLLKDAMMGNPNVDIHDVITAMSKAELGVNVATGVTTKVIQAYDKIMQIQL